MKLDDTFQKSNDSENGGRYISKVSLTLQINGFNVETREFTEELGVQPTFVRKGLWVYNTDSFVASSDVNTHIRFILPQFLPVVERITELGLTVNINIYFESNLLNQRDGPAIEPESIRGLAKLGAGVSVSVVNTSVGLR